MFCLNDNVVLVYRPHPEQTILGGSALCIWLGDALVLVCPPLVLSTRHKQQMKKTKHSVQASAHQKQHVYTHI